MSQRRGGAGRLTPGCSRALAALTLALTVTSAACSRPLLLRAGEAAYARGERSAALASWLASRQQERMLLGRRERAELDDRIADTVRELSMPAERAARAAMAAGDGDRALDVLLPLYAGKGLWSHLRDHHLDEARDRIIGDLREALSIAAGIDLQALTGDTDAIDAAGGRIAALRRRLDVVPANARGPLVAALGDLAGPTLDRGWEIVRELLAAERTLEAMTLADRLAAVLPGDRTQNARRSSTRNHCRQIHSARAAKVCPARPGLCWAELELARRFGGRGGGAVATQLRAVHYRAGPILACPELQTALRAAVARGSSGIPIEVTVKTSACPTASRQWQTASACRGSRSASARSPTSSATRPTRASGCARACRSTPTRPVRIPTSATV